MFCSNVVEFWGNDTAALICPWIFQRY